MEMTFIGDCHGLFSRYEKIIEKFPNSIQIGDMGVGFKKWCKLTETFIFTSNPPYDKMVKTNARFIRGNHDNPSVCAKHSQWIADGHTETTENGTKIMYIGGAWSIDHEYRTEDVSWWADEEVSFEKWFELINLYEEFKPDIMVTHDAPEIVCKEMFLNGTHKPLYKSRTGQALESLFLIHKPKTWLFGHWHKTQTNYILGTEFTCLNELDMVTLDV